MGNKPYAYMIINGNINIDDVVLLLERNFQTEYDFTCESSSYVDHLGQTDKYFTIWGKEQQVCAEIQGGDIVTRTGLGIIPGQFDEQQAMLNAKTLSLVGLALDVAESQELFKEIYQVLAVAFPQNVLVWEDYEAPQTNPYFSSQK